MSTKGMAIVLGCFVVIICVSLFCSSIKGDYYYADKIVFNSEQEYSQFKQTLIDTNATWVYDSMQVLSSVPPIIVKFRYIQVPYGESFPYGNKFSGLIPLVISLIIGVVTTLLGMQRNVAYKLGL